MTPILNLTRPSALDILGPTQIHNTQLSVHNQLTNIPYHTFSSVRIVDNMNYCRQYAKIARQPEFIQIIIEQHTLCYVIWMLNSHQ